MPDYLILEHLEKRFGATYAPRDLSLAVGRSEILALLGPSGSGKTTVLRLIAGFEKPDAGRIRVEGEDVTGLPPERRRFGMVFQHYALFPHMTAGENVAFGLESRGVGKAETVRRVADTLAIVDLSGFEGRAVTQLSGGQQQRIALARALAPQPRILLLDEPLSNLDPALRERTRRELRGLIRRIGITTLLVTHEQEEAFDLGDRVAVVNRGRLEQVGTSEELYEEPASRFVATFVGKSNVLPAIWADGVGAVRLAQEKIWRATADGALAPELPVDLVVRPEGLLFSDPSAPDSLSGEVLERRYAGREASFLVRLDDAGEVEVIAPAGAARPGQRVAVVPAPAGPIPRAYPKERS